MEMPTKCGCGDHGRMRKGALGERQALSDELRVRRVRWLGCAEAPPVKRNNVCFP